MFLRIETKKNFFSNLFKFPLSAGEKKKYIKLTNYSLKVQFTFKITNKQQQQQQKETPTITLKAKCVVRQV